MAKLSEAKVRLLRDALATSSASERVRDFSNARTLDSLERLGFVFVYRSLQPMYYDTTRAGDAALQEHLKAVPPSFTGHSPLEEAVVLLSDAVVRAIKKEAKGKDGDK